MRHVDQASSVVSQCKLYLAGIETEVPDTKRHRRYQYRLKTNWSDVPEKYSTAMTGAVCSLAGGVLALAHRPLRDTSEDKKPPGRSRGGAIQAFWSVLYRALQWLRRPRREYIGTSNNKCQRSAMEDTTDRAEAPLMSEHYDGGDEERMADDIALNDDTGSLLERDLRRPGLFVWLLTVTAGISGLLFGCKIPQDESFRCIQGSLTSMQTILESFLQHSSQSEADCQEGS